MICQRCGVSMPGYHPETCGKPSKLWLRDHALGYARDLGCDAALVQAISLCQSPGELEQTAHEAIGPGSKSWRAWMLAYLESQTDQCPPEIMTAWRIRTSLTGPNLPSPDYKQGWLDATTYNNDRSHKLKGN